MRQSDFFNIEALTTLKNCIDTYRSTWKERRSNSKGPDTAEYTRATRALQEALAAEKGVDNCLNMLLEEGPLPPWANHPSDGRFDEIGAQLATKDGRRHGNAVVIGLEFTPELGILVSCITDAGNRLDRRTMAEMASTFHTPRWVMSMTCLTDWLRVLDQHSQAEGYPSEGFKENHD